MITQPVVLANLEIQHDPINVSIGSGVDLTIWEHLYNEGALFVNDNSGPDRARLLFPDDVTLAGLGTIELNALTDPSQAEIRALGDAVVVNRGVIEGSGTITGAFINDGTIMTDSFEGSGMVINGQITQAQDSLLRVRGSTLELAPNASVTGGRFELDFGTLVLNEGTQFLPDELDIGTDTTLKLQGALEHPFPTLPTDTLILSNESEWIVTGDYTNNGEILINEGEPMLGATVSVRADAEIGGTGSVVLLPGFVPSRNPAIRTDGPYTLTIGAGQEIEGSGRLDGDGGGLILNNGTARTGINGRITIDGNISGGSYLADAGEVFVGGAVISNAQFRSHSGGTVNLGGARLINPYFEADDPIRVTTSGTTLVGSIIQYGDMQIGAPFSDSELEIEPGATLIGAGHFELAAEGSEILGEFTLPETFTISGTGRIRADIVNQSVITATEPGVPLYISGRQQGGLYVADNGMLVLSGDHIEGEYVSRDGLIMLTHSTFDGSHVRSESGGDIRLNPGSDAEFIGCIADLSLDVCDDSVVTFIGNSQVNGEHYILDHAQIDLRTARLEGEGKIFMREQPLAFGRPALHAAGGNCTIGPGYRIAGSGTIQSLNNATLVCEGEIVADDPFAAMWLAGNIESPGGLLADGGTFELRNGLRLESTVISAKNGGSVGFGSGEITLVDTENRAVLSINDGSTVVNILGSLINNGSISIGSSQQEGGGVLRAQEPTEITGNGSISMQSYPGESLPNLFGIEPLTIGSGQRIEGDGRIGGDVVFGGTLAPGGDDRRFEVANLELTPETRLEIDIAGSGPDDHDYLRTLAGGGTQLAGTIIVSFENGATPTFGDRWAVIRGGQPSGRFSAIESAQPLPAGWEFIQIHHADGVDLVVSCPGDRDGNGERNFFDVIDFINDYGSQSPDADTNGDGVINFFDIAEFIEDFSRECTP